MLYRRIILKKAVARGAISCTPAPRSTALFRIIVAMCLLVTCAICTASDGYADDPEPTVDPGYVISKVWPTSDSFDMSGATAIAYDPYDDVFYVTDTLHGRVWKIDSDRTITIETDTLDTPVDAAVDPTNGDLYIADFYRGQIAILGSDQPLVSGLGRANAVATSPIGDNVGTTYVADGSDGTIFFVNFEQKQLDTLATGFADPTDLLYDGIFDFIYIVDSAAGAVFVIDPFQPQRSNTFLLADNLNSPLYADFGFHNDLLVTQADGKILSIDLTGKGDGETASVSQFAAGFADVQGIVSTPVSDQLPTRVYVADRQKGAVYMIQMDSDGDGLGDADETEIFGTDPETDDTDMDGLTDGDETNVYGTDPLDYDSDDDGLMDGVETLSAGTDPLDADTDDDGFSDAWEYYSLSNPLDAADTPATWADLDADFLRGDLEMLAFGTDPDNADTDGDGTSDWAELAIGSDPLDPDIANTGSRYDDNDRDGLDHNTELLIGTDPFNPDTDGDGVPDGRELIFDKTSPLDPDDFIENDDPDGDGLTNENEKVAGTDPNVADTDGDGLSDSTEAFGDTDGDGLFGYEETVFGTDPDIADTNGDGTLDIDEALADQDGDSLLAIDEIRFGTSDTDADTDNDGYTDYAEAFGDIDGDGLTGFEEHVIFGTDPDVADTDGDGFFDGWEVAVGTDPNDGSDSPELILDLDDDGLTGAEEIRVGSDPDNADTDGDGFPDGVEIALASDPTDPDVTNLMLGDTDGDGLTDTEETFYGTDPANPDSDGDLYEDGLEVAIFGTDPTDPVDTPEKITDRDADGLTGAEEARFGTDPNVADTDNNGLLDGYEATDDIDGDGLNGFDEAVLGTDPFVTDTDGDGVSDQREAVADPDGDGVRTIDELRFGTDPYDSDTDGDGTTDNTEFYGDIDGDGLPGVFERTLGTDPYDKDSDDDGLDDGAEYTGGTDPLDGTDSAITLGPELDDLDGDGLAGIAEAAVGTDPTDADTDDDGTSDGAEVAAGTDPLDPTQRSTPGQPQSLKVVVQPTITGPVFVGMSVRFVADLWLPDGTQIPAGTVPTTFRSFGAGSISQKSGTFTATSIGRAAVTAVVEYNGHRIAGGTTFRVHAGLLSLELPEIASVPGSTLSIPLTARAETFSASSFDLDIQYPEDLVDVTGVTPTDALTNAGRTITWSAANGHLDIRVTGDVRGVIPTGVLCNIEITVAPDAPDADVAIEFGRVTVLARAARASYWMGSTTSSGRILVEKSEPVRGTPDIDDNGHVDAVDIQKTINQALGLLRFAGDAIADIDDNGHIDASDVQMVINAALGVMYP